MINKRNIDFEALFVPPTSIKKFKDLIEQGFNASNIIEPDRKRPLINYLIDKIFDPDPSQKKFIDSQQDCIKFFYELIKIIDINKKTRSYPSPLDDCLQHYVEGWQHYYKRNSSSSRETPLEMALALLELGAKPDLDKNSSLYILLAGDYYEGYFSEERISGINNSSSDEYNVFKTVVRKLVATGASVDRLDRKGRYNPLIVAAAMGSVRLTQLFLELGATVNIKNKSDATPLMFVAGLDQLPSTTLDARMRERTGEPKLVAKILIEHGADPRVENKNRNTALKIACKQANYDVAFEIAKVLIKQQAFFKEDLKLFHYTTYEEELSSLLPELKNKPKEPKKIEGQTQSWAKAQKKIEKYMKGDITGSYKRIYSLCFEGIMRKHYEQKVFIDFDLGGVFITNSKSLYAGAYVLKEVWLLISADEKPNTIMITFSSILTPMFFKANSDGSFNEQEFNNVIDDIFEVLQFTQDEKVINSPLESWNHTAQLVKTVDKLLKHNCADKVSSLSRQMLSRCFTGAIREHFQQVLFTNFNNGIELSNTKNFFSKKGKIVIALYYNNTNQLNIYFQTYNAQDYEYVVHEEIDLDLESDMQVNELALLKIIKQLADKYWS